MSGLVDEKIPLSVRGYNSISFCEDLADCVAREAFSQYGKTDSAIFAFRIKCENVSVLFVDNHGMKNWKKQRRITVARMGVIIERMGHQEKLLK